MDLPTLLKDLSRRHALIVHFSHLQNMREDGVFPDDLFAAIANKDSWNLSCSVIWPGHSMALPGEVGLILRPTAIEQVLSVGATDTGSSMQPDGEDVSGGAPLDATSFSDTFAVTAGEYNEWRVRGAEVAGVYVARPEGAQAKGLQPVSADGVVVGETIFPKWRPLAEIKTAFAAYPVVTMGALGPVIL